jgi:deoxycytidylate deaminase
MIYNGNKLISVGVNKYKGHPRQINPHTHTLGTSIHAELDAVLKSGRTGLQGATLYVARRLKNGRFGIAKPCQSCMLIIGIAGIKKVVYTTYDGWQVLNLE